MKEWYEEYFEMEEKKRKLWEFIILNKMNEKDKCKGKFIEREKKDKIIDERSSIVRKE